MQVHYTIRYLRALVVFPFALLFWVGCETNDSAKEAIQTTTVQSSVDAVSRSAVWTDVRRVFTPVAVEAIQAFDRSIKPLEAYRLSPDYKIYDVNLKADGRRCIFTITLSAHVYSDLKFKYRGYMVDRSSGIPIYIAFYQRHNDHCDQSAILQGELLKSHSVNARPIFADSTLAVEDLDPFEGPIRGYHVVSHDSLSMVFDYPSH